MKKNKKLEERRKKIPKDLKIFMDKSFDIVEQIDIILTKQGKSQKDLADALHKKESEISKWMRGTHNFTQRTLAKIESVLGETITICPKDIKVPDLNAFVFSPNQIVVIKGEKTKQRDGIKKNYDSKLFVQSKDKVSLQDYIPFLQ